jgi:hypothetical protein
MKPSVPYEAWSLKVEVDATLTLAEGSTVVGAGSILAHSPVVAPLRLPSAEDETRIADAMRSLPEPAPAKA